MATQSLSAGSDLTPATSPTQAPKLLQRLWSALVARRYRAETVGRFTEWTRQFILFHGKRHPDTMGREEIEQFLGHLAQAGHGAELQAEARQAVAFLYREILGRALPWPEVGRIRPAGSAGNGPPRLLERMCEIMRARGYSSRTEECYVMWARRYILFHNKRHPLNQWAAAVGRNQKGAVHEPRIQGSQGVSTGLPIGDEDF